MRLLYTIVLIILAGCCLKAQNTSLYASDKLSSNNITCFCQDSSGYIWIGTQYGLNRFDGYNFTVYLSDPGKENSLSDNNITSLYTDPENGLWIGTRKGFCYYDREHDEIIPIWHSRTKPRAEVFCPLKDGRLLLGTSSYGLYEIDKSTLSEHRFHDYSVDDNNDFYYIIFQDSKERIWKTDNNNVISCFPKEGKKLIFREKSDFGKPQDILEKDGTVFIVCGDGIILFKDGETQKIALKNFGITSAVKLKNNTILLGTQTQGVVNIDISGGDCQITGNFVPTASVTALFEDRDGNIWAASKNKGIIFISAKQSIFSSWNIPSDSQSDFTVVNAAALSSKGTLWCSLSNGSAVEVDSSGQIVKTVKGEENMCYICQTQDGKMYSATQNAVYSFNPETGTNKLLKAYLDCERITSIIEKDGSLYIARHGKGLEIFNLKTLDAENLNMYQISRNGGFLCNDWINDMLLDSNMLWIATVSGVTCYDIKTKEFSLDGKTHILNDINCICLEKISPTVTVIGTEKGLYAYYSDKQTVEVFPNSSSLEGITIKKILNNDGNLWISTSNGIWHYKYKENIFIPYIGSDGLVDKEYSENIGINILPELSVFGNSKGFTAFNPKYDSFETDKPGTPFLTDVFISGNKITGEEKNSPVLEYRDNSVIMNFTVFDYASTKNISYEYSLNGNPKVKLPAGENSVSLYNLPAGRYKMDITATNNNGGVSEKRRISILVKEPWYKSTVAILLYIFTCIAIIIYIIIRIIKVKKHRIYEEKTQFLINATHDIRTPLTMIISPLNQLLKEETSDDKRRRLMTISRNADKILDLINQILFLRKIDKQQAGILCRKTDLKNYITRSIKLFEDTAKQRDIDFTFNAQTAVEAYVDNDNFDKVINNIISNAFKYTPDGGEITVSLSKDSENALIEVSDTGQGLNENDIKNIVTRCYGSSSRPEVKTEGTGIGLNICKIIVEKHHGTISAKNREDCRGSVFSVTIPLGTSHLKLEEIAEEPEVATQTTAQSKNTPSSKILLVDDSEDICNYILSELSGSFNFQVRHNGKDALKVLMEENIDLVISDIMMPVMDGLTLLRMIKSNNKTNHIPVVLLSGQSEIANRLEGLSRGADGFLAKPFIIEELNVMIKNLLKKNTILKSKFSGNQEFLEQNVKDVQVSNPDKEIVEKVIKNINENLADPDFNVTALAENVGISRVQLHRKLKDFAGINASNLIRNIRLEQAGRMLSETSNTISEIAYAVGFNNVGHFSKVFKQHFGISPKDYAKMQSETDGNENDNEEDM